MRPGEVLHRPRRARKQRCAVGEGPFSARLHPRAIKELLFRSILSFSEMVSFLQWRRASPPAPGSYRYARCTPLTWRAACPLLLVIFRRDTEPEVGATTHGGQGRPPHEPWAYAVLPVELNVPRSGRVLHHHFMREEAEKEDGINSVPTCSGESPDESALQKKITRLGGSSAKSRATRPDDPSSPRGYDPPSASCADCA
jgi:hypothetical protein